MAAAARWPSWLGSSWLGRALDPAIPTDRYAASGYLVASNPANSFFYVLTGLHVLHLLGGLVALARTAGHAWAGALAKTRLGVELCAVYWHFLFVVWLILFGLMLST